MNPMVPGLTGEKMSASDPNSKIDLIDTQADIKKKIKKVFCEEGNVEKNPLLSFIEAVYFLIHPEFELKVRDQPSVMYKDAAAMRADFAAGKIHPADLKDSVVDVLNMLLEPVREKMAEPDMVALTAKAYPPEGKKKKKGALAAARAACRVRACCAALVRSGHVALQLPPCGAYRPLE